MRDRTIVRLSAADFEKMVAYARAGLPNEACGLLAGTEENGVRDIKEVYLLRNLDRAQSERLPHSGRGLHLGDFSAL